MEFIFFGKGVEEKGKIKATTYPRTGLKNWREKRGRLHGNYREERKNYIGKRE